MRPKQRRRILFPVLAFFVPLMALFAACLWLGVAPFGDKSLLTLDLRQQYAQFFAWMRQNLLAGESLFFSPARGFGGGTVGLVAYYLLSPLNLFFLLFDSASVPEAVLVVSLLKIGLCGLTMYLFLSRCGRSAPFPALLCAWCYALSAYPVVFLSNLMWLDAVYLLPLIALGIEQLLLGEKPFLYLFSLAAGIACNAYIGIALCLFSVLYGVLVVLRDRPPRPGRGVARFAGCSLLAGGLCAVLLLPTLMALGDSKAVLGGAGLTLDPKFHWPAFFTRLFTSQVEYIDYVSGPPNIFSGLLAVLGALLLLLNRSIPPRRRLVPLGLLVLLALSMWISGVNRIWHGLNEPVWFTFRYSFLFSFVLLTLAAEGLSRQREEPRPSRPWLALLLTMGLVLVAVYGAGGFLSRSHALLIGAVLLGMTLALSPLPRVPRRALSFVLLLLCVADLAVNLYLPLRIGRFDDRAEYAEAYDAWSEIKAESEARVGGFFRVERLGNLRTDDNMLVNVPSVSHYSSTAEIFVLRFLAQMGIGDTGPSIRYEEGTSLPADSFLGVRFLASAEERTNVEYFSPVARLSSGETLYENPYALPLAFGVDTALLDLHADTRDKLDWQNRLWAAATGDSDLAMLQAQDSEMDFTGYQANQESAWVCYMRQTEDAVIRYTIDVRDAGPLYAYLVSTWEGENSTSIRLNGTPLREEYFASRGYGVLSLGTYAPGDQVVLELDPTDDALRLGKACFYTMDLPVFAQAVETLRANAFEVREMHNDAISLTGEIREEGQMLLLTLPALAGWHATANGEAVAVERAADALIALPLPPGEYRVELRFTPPGLRIGCGISIACYVICVGYGLWRKKRRNHEEKA